jgi:hypothetical protein
MGIKHVLTTEGPEQDILYKKQEGLKDSGDEVYLNLWKPSCVKACKELKPDIIVCDFFSRNGVFAADEMGIPVVINCPGPLPFLKNFFNLRTPDMKNASTCCGMICIK